MKSNYRIAVYRLSGELITLDAYCSRFQAEKAFYSLCYMLNQKPYKSVRLQLVHPFGLESLLECEVNHG